MSNPASVARSWSSPNRSLTSKGGAPTRPRPFGYELLLDCYRCLGVCDDLSICYAFLSSIVSALRVHAQAPPFLVVTDARVYPDKAGISGWIPLVESGVQVHTLSPKSFITIDVYSCRRFDPHIVKSLVHRFFHPLSIDAHWVVRGVRYHAR